jgi:muramidase (phage lysozyme)
VFRGALIGWFFLPESVSAHKLGIYVTHQRPMVPMMNDADLNRDIAAFEALVSSKVPNPQTPWVVMYKGELIASFSDYNEAVGYAIVNLPKDEFFIGDIHETRVEVPLVVLLH